MVIDRVQVTEGAVPYTGGNYKLLEPDKNVISVRDCNSEYAVEVDSNRKFDYQQTCSGLRSKRYLYDFNENNIIIEALTVINKCENKEQLEKAKEILNFIQVEASIFQNIDIRQSIFPNIHAFFVGDGSVLLEWIFDDFRIGFSIENNPEESGWYLVSKRDSGAINASGFIDANLINIIRWLIAFIILHDDLS